MFYSHDTPVRTVGTAKGLWPCRSPAEAPDRGGVAPSDDLCFDTAMGQALKALGFTGAAFEAKSAREQHELTKTVAGSKTAGRRLIPA